MNKITTAPILTYFPLTEGKFIQTEFGIVYQPGDAGVYVPVTINSFVLDTLLHIEIKEYSDISTTAQSFQFSSLISVETKAEEQARQFISTRYKKYADILHYVLFKVTRQAKFPKEEFSNSIKPINLLDDAIALSGSDLIIERKVSEEIRSNNYFPSIDMRKALENYQYYFINRKFPEGVKTHCFNLIPVIGEIIIPDFSIELGCFTDYSDDELDIFNDFNIFCFSDDNDKDGYFSVSFDALLSDQITKFTYKTPNNMIKEGSIPDCYIKAVEKYCELNGNSACEIGFYLGILYIEFSLANTLDRYDPNAESELANRRYNWFYAGMSNYLKTYQSIKF